MMKLRNIRISNFRKFVEPVFISGLSDGMNILAGDNEDGKSTIVQAIKSVFFTKYNTSSTAHIQPYNSTAMPEVEVDFDLRDGHYQLRKVFGRKGMAELRGPGAVFNGPDAEAKLQELCLTGGAGTKDTSTMWGVLWVEQGTAFDTPAIGELGKQTLSTALESELGKVIGGDEGQTLLLRLRETYHKWYTEKAGKDSKNSEFREAEENFVNIDRAFQECNNKYQEYEDTLERVQFVRDALKKHTVEKTLDKACERLNECVKRQADVLEKRQDAARLQHQTDAQTAQYKAVADEFRLRRTTLSELTELEKKQKESAQSLENVQTQHALANTAMTQAQLRLTEAESNYEKVCAQISILERQEQLMRLQQECKTVEERCDQAKTALAQGKALEKELAGIKVDANALNKLRILEREALQSEARLDAVSTRLDFAPLPGQQVLQQGTPLDHNVSCLLTSFTELELVGWGKIAVYPGGTDLDKLQAACAHNKKQYEEALSTLCVDSVAQAAEQERRRNDLMIECQGLLKQYKHLAPNGLNSLLADLAQVQTRYTEAQSVIPAEADLVVARDVVGTVSTFAESINPQSETSLESLSSTLNERRRARDEARRIGQSAKTTKDKCTEDLRRIESEIQKLTSEQQQLQIQHTQLLGKLEQARATESDDDLERRMTESKVLLERTSIEKQTLDRALKELNADSIEQELVTNKSHIQRIEAEIAQLTGDLRELLGVLQTFGASGITEELERLKGKREQASVQLERARHKARAIKLLWETVSSAEKHVKAQLSAPLMRHLEPYVSQVFAESKINFDSGNYTIAQLQRPGLTEEYMRLSLGTREQLSILMRLAFAQVLVESGIPAIVILDDALVYSDQDRLEKMQHVLLEASKRYQVIMLTCRERDYAHLPAHSIRLDECIRSGGSNCGALKNPTSKVSPISLPLGQLTMSSGS